MNYTAEGYVDDVLSGAVAACRWVRLACERHRRDLEDGHERGLWFDEKAAKRAVLFFRALRHSKGEWAGQPIVLEPWQQAHFWILFGWMRADGSRRFRTSYLEVARKNGKSLMASGVGIYGLVADGESGAEIYTAATKKEQARIIHGEAVRMVKQSPVLRRRLGLFRDNINHEETFSKYEPLGRDSKTLDGLNVHMALVDELHAHPTGDLWDVLETATGARRQPLLYAVTTAGNNRVSICYQLHDYTKKVLEGVVEDDSHYGVIYSLDRLTPDDGLGEGPLEDWEDEAVWVKANPNLGVSKKLDNMRDKARKAKNIPARLNAFLQKELNVWVQGDSRWLLPEQWRRCDRGAVDEEALLGLRCWGGLDLSSTRDITAWIKVFEQVGGVHPVVCRFWIPEDRIMERVKRDRVPYDAWVRGGFLETTPGGSVDYEWILAQIRDDMARFDLQEVMFDPWRATHVSNTLIAEGAMMIEFRQGYVSMNPAVMALEVGIERQAINHGGHPVLSWMADNVIMTMDPTGSRKPDKDKSREKIDGIVGLLMAYYRATLGGNKDSVYEERGLRVL